MGRVRLLCAASPVHARTARLVAAAAARRVGIGEERTEVVRQAVGEACTLVLGRLHDVPGAMIELVVDDDPAPGDDVRSVTELLVVELRGVLVADADRAPAGSPDVGGAGGARAPSTTVAVSDLVAPDLVMTMLAGLTDTLDTSAVDEAAPGLRLGWSG